MKFSKRIVQAIMVSMLLAVSTSPVYGKVITYTPTGVTSAAEISKSDINSKTESQALGPGYVEVEESVYVVEDESVVFNGPVVKKVSLIETYHELYDIYEESLSDTYFLYTNVANGGLTHESVTIDIPANVIYTMEKDGVPYGYVSRQKISEKGTYVLRLSAVENPELPFSEQTEYQAVFRFRIHDEPPVTESESFDPEVSAGSIWEPDTDEMAIDVSALISDGSTETETETKAEETMESVSAEETVSESITDDTSNADLEATEETSTETTVESEESQDEAETSAEAEQAVLHDREQVYDPETGFYTISLENGMKVLLNVEDGYKGAGPVQFAVADEDLPMTALYRGSERITLTNSSRTIIEHGKYTVALADNAGNISSVHFTIPYQMNIYGIVAIVLCVLVVAGVVVFVVLTKKNIKIR